LICKLFETIGYYETSSKMFYLFGER